MIAGFHPCHIGRDFAVVCDHQIEVLLGFQVVDGELQLSLFAAGGLRRVLGMQPGPRGLGVDAVRETNGARHLLRGNGVGGSYRFPLEGGDVLVLRGSAMERHLHIEFEAVRLHRVGDVPSDLHVSGDTVRARPVKAVRLRVEEPRIVASVRHVGDIPVVRIFRIPGGLVDAVRVLRVDLMVDRAGGDVLDADIGDVGQLGAVERVLPVKLTPILGIAVLVRPAIELVVDMLHDFQIAVGKYRRIVIQAAVAYIRTPALTAGQYGQQHDGQCGDDGDGHRPDKPLPHSFLFPYMIRSRVPCRIRRITAHYRPWNLIVPRPSPAGT